MTAPDPTTVYRAATINQATKNTLLLLRRRILDNGITGSTPLLDGIAAAAIADVVAAWDESGTSETLVETSAYVSHWDGYPHGVPNPDPDDEPAGAYRA